MYKHCLFTTFIINISLSQSVVLGSEMQDRLDNSIVFMGRKCSIEIQVGENVYEKACDRLVITGVNRKEDINFHFDDSDKNGFTFIVDPQGKKVIDNDYLLLNQHRAFASFIWTKEDGVLEDTFIRGEGSCHVLRTKVLCMLKTNNDFRADAYFEF